MENDQSPFSQPAPWDQPAQWAQPAPWNQPLPERPAPPPPSSSSRPLYELRPLSLGEILDRTFALYRRRFWLYAGLSSIAAAVPTLSTLAQFAFALPTARARPEEAARRLAIMFGIILIASFFALVAYSFTQSATVAAVSAAYIGEETSIGAALRIARRHWFRYILITLWLGWSGVWLPVLIYSLAIGSLVVPGVRLLFPLLLLLVLASFVYGVIAYIRNSLGVVASTVEDLKVRKAMRRSKVLVAGHKWRVFAILLLTAALQIAASVFQGIVGFFVGVSHGAVKLLLEAIALLVTFATTAMVVPVAAIALCLFYIDERVRKEGFDLEILLLRGAPAPPPAPESLPSPFSSELA